MILYIALLAAILTLVVTGLNIWHYRGERRQPGNTRPLVTYYIDDNVRVKCDSGFSGPIVVKPFHSYAVGDHEASEHWHPNEKRAVILEYMAALGYVRQNAIASGSPTPNIDWRDWLDTAGFFLPAEVRETFWYHMLEDRDEMRERGQREWFINLAILSQSLCLLVRGSKDVLLHILGRSLPKQP